MGFQEGSASGQTHTVGRPGHQCWNEGQLWNLGMDRAKHVSMPPCKASYIIGMRVASSHAASRKCRSEHLFSPLINSLGLSTPTLVCRALKDADVNLNVQQLHYWPYRSKNLQIKICLLLNILLYCNFLILKIVNCLSKITPSSCLALWTFKITYIFALMHLCTRLRIHNCQFV